MIKSLIIVAALASTLSACAYEYPSEKNLDDRAHAEHYREDSRNGHYHGDVYYRDSESHSHEGSVVQERTYHDGDYSRTVTTIEKPVATKRYYYRDQMYDHGRSTNCSPLKYKNGWC